MNISPDGVRDALGECLAQRPRAVAGFTPSPIEGVAGRMSVAVTGEDYLSLEHQVCFALAVASRDVISLYRPLLAPLGLTHPQYLVMVSLWHDNKQTSVTELSKVLGWEPPALSPVLKRLEAAGLVNRRRDDPDQRTVHISLTAQGRALREKALDIPMAIVERLDMTIEELELLRTMLTKVIRQANTIDTGTSRSTSS